MENLQAFILGIVQGLTEFLPISSSGHLMLIPSITGWNYFGKYFDVALHIGTFISLLIYYRTMIVELFKNFIKGLKNIKEINKDPGLRTPWLILTAAVPGGLIGLIFGDFIEKNLNSVPIAAICLIAFGILLAMSESMSSNKLDMEGIDFKKAFIIGCSQAVALIPGVSRSGITMTVSMFMGMKKETAANFSFLASLPLIGGAALYTALKMIKDPSMLSSLGIFIIGIISAGISGYFVIKFLLDYLKKGSFQIFMYYRIALGVIMLGLYFWGVIK